MAASVSITKTALGLLQDRFAALNLKKRKSKIFSCAISDDVIGWVGLNSATHGRGYAVDVNPVVGVRYQRIERLIAELNGDAFNGLIPPTIAGNVGYLSPANAYLSFSFARASPSNEAVADQLCAAVATYGVPFMKKAADLRSLVETMQEARFASTEQLSYRLPIGFWLLGLTEKAKASVSARLADISTRSDPAGVHYKRFAMNLIDQMASTPAV